MREPDIPAAVRAVLASHPHEKAIDRLVGAVMAQTHGTANPTAVRAEIARQIAARSQGKT
jgi:Asp-tRNA(Asn)/Glu-tRNA(Gln) amidotransferase B subunit